MDHMDQIFIRKINLLLQNSQLQLTNVAQRHELYALLEFYDEFTSRNAMTTASLRELLRAFNLRARIDPSHNISGDPTNMDVMNQIFIRKVNTLLQSSRLRLNDPTQRHEVWTLLYIYSEFINKNAMTKASIDELLRAVNDHVSGPDLPVQNGDTWSQASPGYVPSSLADPRLHTNSTRSSPTSRPGPSPSIVPPIQPSTLLGSMAPSMTIPTPSTGAHGLNLAGPSSIPSADTAHTGIEKVWNDNDSWALVCDGCGRTRYDIRGFNRHMRHECRNVRREGFNVMACDPSRSLIWYGQDDDASNYQGRVEHKPRHR